LPSNLLGLGLPIVSQVIVVNVAVGMVV